MQQIVPEREGATISRRKTATLRSRMYMRMATPDDWPLIRRWLRQPDVARWWGSTAAAEAEIRLAFETEASICRIIECDGEPIGYAHAIDAAYWGDDLPSGMPPGTWDVDIFIASSDHRGTGAGPIALDALVNEVFATTMALAVSVFVSVKNEAATRAYERAGFEWKSVWFDPTYGPCWMLLQDRPE